MVRTERDSNPYRAPIAPSRHLVVRGQDPSLLNAGMLFLFLFRGRMPRSVWWTGMLVLPVTLGLTIELSD